MKMRNLLVGIILGLLAVVHTTPIGTVTQIPTKGEEDFLEEAGREGFLVLTTESPTRKTTIHVSQQMSFDAEGSEDHFATTTQTVSHAQSSSPTVLSRDTDDFSSDSSTSQNAQAGFTSSSVPDEAQSSITSDYILVSPTTDPESGNRENEESGEVTTTMADLTSQNTLQMSTEPEESGSGLTVTTTMADLTSHNTLQMSTEPEGSGSGLPEVTTTMADLTSQNTLQMSIEPEGSGSGLPEETIVSSTIDLIRQNTHQMLAKAIGSGTESSIESLASTASPSEEENPDKIAANQRVQLNELAPMQNSAHSTPGWIIIVGFIVGVAALVMVCVAIATRDKWNGPNQVSQSETKTDSSNQQRELEMETFLQKDKPRENGKAAEYTVIPLDELPEDYSTH
ncbi:mucin-4 isoform X1 [Lates calcarifer]|uniref:Mucin-4 isoform X1 n=1 Tax=Lates calcarifer TaxID=8187 RepID=A0AAJ7V7D6_LATCA|nr:mucin-4 isoform X1 [Lates calcarifer]